MVTRVTLVTMVALVTMFTKFTRVTRVTRVTMVAMVTMVTMVTTVTMVIMGGDLQPVCLADQLLTGLSQPQINPSLGKEKKKYSVLLRKEIINKLVVDLY